MHVSQNLKSYIKKTGAVLYVPVFLFILLFLFQTNKAQALTVSPPRIEITSDPGQTVEQTFKVINEEKQSKTLFLIPQNFETKDESGDPNFVEGRENLAGWIKAPESINVGPGEIKEIKFKIQIPSNAEPGGYFTALFLQHTPPSFEQGTGVAIGSQLGTLILLRVNGNISDEAGILEFNTKNKSRFFKTLPIEFYYRFQNTGDVWVKPLGDILITNSIGKKNKILSANRQKGNVLPKSIRKFESIWANSGGNLQESADVQANYPEIKGFWNNVNHQRKNLAIGVYKAQLNLAYGTDPVKVGNDDFYFIVFPWELSLVSFITLLVLLIILRFLVKRYNRMIVKKAQRAAGIIEPPKKPKQSKK